MLTYGVMYLTEVTLSVPECQWYVRGGWGGQAADSDWSVRSPNPFGMAFGRLTLSPLLIIFKVFWAHISGRQTPGLTRGSPSAFVI
jgi:hypothetical protein